MKKMFIAYVKTDDDTIVVCGPDTDTVRFHEGVINLLFNEYDIDEIKSIQIDCRCDWDYAHYDFGYTVEFFGDICVKTDSDFFPI